MSIHGFPTFTSHANRHVILYGVIKMGIQRTFSIIKPDATKRNLTGAIVAKFETAGLRV